MERESEIGIDEINQKDRQKEKVGAELRKMIN